MSLNVYDILIISAIAVCVGAVIAYIRKRHKRGDYCSGCSGCCDNCAKKNKR